MIRGDRRVDHLPPGERNIAMVFQSIALYPNRNVQDNILFALKVAKVPREIQQQRLRDVTRLLGIDRYLGRRIHQLSGGERQRVGVARALAADPPVVLMDEPFGALDPITRAELHREFKRIQRRVHKTVVLVTHDMREAFTLADRIGVLDAGVLVEYGSRAALQASTHPTVRMLVESTMD
jgi:osmoprotectant transport system ATP-binding protein